MSTELTVVIDADSISYLEHDTREPLIDGGETHRASWVVPANPLKRVAFLSLIHISEPTRRHHVSRMPSSA